MSWAETNDAKTWNRRRRQKRRASRGRCRAATTAENNLGTAVGVLVAKAEAMGLVAGVPTKNSARRRLASDTHPNFIAPAHAYTHVGATSQSMEVRREASASACDEEARAAAAVQW